MLEILGGSALLKFPLRSCRELAPQVAPPWWPTTTKFARRRGPPTGTRADRDVFLAASGIALAFGHTRATDG